MRRKMIFADIFTDFHDTADTGRILTVIVLLAMIVIQVISTISSTTHAFDAQSFGIGCGAVIGALAAYIYGDAKGQQLSAPSAGTIKQTQSLETTVKTDAKPAPSV